MIRSLIYSITFHSVLILLTILSLPFMLREPIDLPPIVSVELIQITDKTSIPYAPKARKIIEETKKKEEERLVSEQAPPAAKAKEKPFVSIVIIMSGFSLKIIFTISFT